MIEREKQSKRYSVYGKEGAKLLGSVAYAALFFAPHATNHALASTSAEVEIAEFPTTISFYPGESRLDILNQASVYADEEKYGVGIRAKVTGLPRFDSNDKLEDYLSTERFEVYLSLADTPAAAVSGYEKRLRDDAFDRFRSYEALGSVICGGAIYGGVTLLQQRRRIRKLEGRGGKEGPSRRRSAGLALAALAGSFGVAAYTHASWSDSMPRPDDLRTITALDSTSLEGTQIDNSWVLDAVNDGIRYGSRLKDRRIEQREAYLDRAIPQIQQQITTLPDLRDNEELFFVMTDMHASNAGIRLADASLASLQDRYDPTTVRAIFNIGDMYQGTAVQRNAVLDQAFADRDIPVAVSRGNHDPAMTSDWLKDAGMTELTGLATINDIKVYGQPDVQQTPLFRPSYFVNPDINETTLGETARRDVDESPADIVNLHQPAAVEAFLDTESITSYLESDEDEQLTECDFGIGTIKEFPARLIQAGHWHDQYPLKMVCGSDGKWSVINIQGTGGGANEAPTPNNWSDPGGKPVKTVSFRAFIRNTKYDSITGAIDIQIETSGRVLPLQRTDIGTATGTPFTRTFDDTARSARRNQKNAP